MNPALLQQGIMSTGRAPAVGQPGGRIDTTAPVLPQALQNYLNRPTPIDMLDKYYSVLVGGVQSPEPKEPLPPMDPYTNPGLSAADFLPGRTEFPSMPPPTPARTDLPMIEPGDNKYTTPVAAPLDSTMFAVKEKGGNWKAGRKDPDVQNEDYWSPEKYVNRVKQAARLRPERIQSNMESDLEHIDRLKSSDGNEQRLEELEYRVNQDRRDLAINDWLDTKMVNYIKNEMGTTEDPVMDLAKRGVLHLPIEQGGRTYEADVDFLMDRRAEFGYPISDYSDPSLESTWALASEMSLDRMTLGEYKDRYPKDVDPWMEKAPDDTIINMMPRQMGINKLGIEHIIDRMKDMSNPDMAGEVPDKFNIDYRDYKKMSVPQMIERISEFDTWRLNSIAEANAALANNAATTTVKEYDNGNKWVQIGVNEQTTDKDVETALGYEGDTMGHCVGGYCNDVINGVTKIFSLRDKKGQPHVTIEMVKETPFDQRAEEFDRIRQELYEQHWEAIHDGQMTQADLDMMADRAARDAQQGGEWVIQQVKGKGNAKPAEKYIPMVQDFIIENKYDVVGDLHHTDLVLVDSLGEKAKERIKRVLPDLDSPYITEDQLDKVYSQDVSAADFLP